jgi:WXG100 family type VII secretion target
MDMMRILLEIARRVLESVIQQVSQQVKLVETDVKNLLENLLGQIIKGAWEGDAADAYVDSVRRNLIPQVGEVITAIAAINTNVTRAKEIVETADKTVAGKVHELSDKYKQIYH